MGDVRQVVFRRLVHQVPHRLAYALHTVGHRSEQARVQRMGEAENLGVAHHHLRRGHRRSVRHRPARRVNRRDAVLDRLAVGESGRAHEVVGVHLDRLAASGLDNARNKGSDAIREEHAGGVVEQDGVHPGDRRHLPDLLGEQVIGVHRRLGEEDRSRNFRVEFLGDPRQSIYVMEVVEHVVDPVGPDTMTVELTHPRIHQIRRGNAHADRGVRSHAATGGRAGDLCLQQVQALPRILTAELDEHLHEGGCRQVDSRESGAVQDIGDRQGVGCLHAHPPQALLSVTKGLVEEVQVRHWFSCSLHG